jgi:hypothetical protein
MPKAASLPITLNRFSPLADSAIAGWNGGDFILYVQKHGNPVPVAQLDRAAAIKLALQLITMANWFGGGFTADERLQLDHAAAYDEPPIAAEVPPQAASA